MNQDQLAQQIVERLTHPASRQPGAILLSGGWGEGKTYFWLNSIEPKLKVKKKVYLYVSLFGANSGENFKSRIVSSFFSGFAKDPENRSTVSTIAATLGKRAGGMALAAAAKWIKEKTDYDFTPFLEGIAGGLDPMQFLPEGLIFCFDDLERSVGNLEEILGLINYLIEHKKARVLLVANEKYLSRKTGDTPEDNAFLSFKEKVVWLSQRYTAPLADVFEHFVVSSAKQENQETIRGVGAAVLEMFSRGEWSNLRTLQRIIRQLDELLSVPKLSLPNNSIRFLSALAIEDARKGKLEAEAAFYNGSKFFASRAAFGKKEDELKGRDLESAEFHERYFGNTFESGCSEELHRFAITGELRAEQLLKELNPDETAQAPEVKLLHKMKGFVWFFANDAQNHSSLAEIRSALELNSAGVQAGVYLKLLWLAKKIADHQKIALDARFTELARERVLERATKEDPLNEWRYDVDSEAEKKLVEPLLAEFRQRLQKNDSDAAIERTVQALSSGNIRDLLQEIEPKKGIDRIVLNTNVLQAAEAALMTWRCPPVR